MNILFVCLGNICRSPAAEAVFRHLVEQASLADQIQIDSAGTVDHHVGELPDQRMRQHGLSRGYRLDMRARQFHPDDFKNFDMIVTMDHSNFHNVSKLAPNEEALSKVVPICDYCQVRQESEVPDPYFGGPEGFDLVLDLLEDACGGLLEHLKEK